MGRRRGQHPPAAGGAHLAPTYGYRIEVAGRRVVWAPEFWQFPTWAAGADLMFADGSAWTRPIRFAHGVGGHASVQDIAEQARRYPVRRLAFAHVGRPSIRARAAVVAENGCVLRTADWTRVLAEPVDPALLDRLHETGVTARRGTVLLATGSEADHVWRWTPSSCSGWMSIWSVTGAR